MLDTSASMTGNLKLLEQAAEHFLLRMLPKDKGLVGAFNDKIEFFPATFTGDRDTLIRSLRELDFGNPTRLYDCIAAAWTACIKSMGGVWSSCSPTVTTPAAAPTAAAFWIRPAERK